jgi:hypothetical protein
LSLEHAEGTLGTASFWMNTDRPPDHARVLWIGAGTRDTGFSLTQLTFQGFAALLLAIAPSGARPPIQIAVLFPAIVFGVAFLVKFFRDRG